MKKTVSLLIITMLFVITGCFKESNSSSNQTGIERLKVLANEKKAATVVKNGIYVKGTTTVMYTFVEFMELSSSEQYDIFSNSNAYLVYKDKYIDMFTFGSDDTVTASSFLNGTNGVRPLVDTTVIPSIVFTRAGTQTTSGTETFQGGVSILTSIVVVSQPLKTNYFLGEALDITGLVVNGNYSNGSIKTESVTAANVTGFSSSTVGIKTLTVTVSGKIASFVVNVSSPVVITSNWEKYGMGKGAGTYVSNNRTYDWYLDQKDTGTHNFENCGPTSATMAIKWANKDFNKTPLDARNTYRPDGGWWYTYDIQNYLNLYNITNVITSSIDGDSLKTVLDKGNIMILCIDSSLIRYNSIETQRVDKYYTGGGGHFIVVQGYVVVDGNLFFEVNDPNSWGAKYQATNEFKGKNRYYRYEDINNTMLIWWPYAIVVSPNQGVGAIKRGMGLSGLKFVNGDEIVHKSGAF